MSKTKVGVLGASGAVGQRLVRMMRNHPWFDIEALGGSERNAGKRYGDTLRPAPASAGEVDPGLLDMRLVPSRAESFTGCRLVFSALPSEAALDLEPELARAGLTVVSNASAHRMAPDVPLLIPEVNHEHAALIEQQRRNRGWSGAIVTNPNCSTISLTLALAPLYRAFGLEQVFVTTLQAVSGSGFNGVSALDIVDNVIPYIGGEEEKMETEPLKLLGTLSGGQDSTQQIVPAQGLSISAQCTRVPTTDGHLEMASIKLGQAVTQEDIIAAWENWKSLPQELELPSAPRRPVVVLSEPNRPQPRFDRDTEHGMATVVGRLRPCPLRD